jgi:hypothetical protein
MVALVLLLDRCGTECDLVKGSSAGNDPLALAGPIIALVIITIAIRKDGETWRGIPSCAPVSPLLPTQVLDLG